MASGTEEQADGLVNTIESDQTPFNYGTLSWVMTDKVAAAFNALPEHERNYRAELLRHLMDSATAVLSCATVTPDAEAAEALCQGLDESAHQAQRILLRLSIMS